MSVPQVHEAFLQYCRPMRARGVWDDKIRDADCHLASLAERFFEEELIAANVARLSPDGLVINPALVGDAVGVVALRNRAGNLPFELLTSHGIVSGNPLPSLSILDDESTRQRMAAVGRKLVVARNMKELIVLRSLGVPVMLASDLGEQTEAGLQALAVRANWANDAEAVNAALPDFDGSTTGANAAWEVRPDLSAKAGSPDEVAGAGGPPSSESPVSTPDGGRSADPRQMASRVAFAKTFRWANILDVEIQNARRVSLNHREFRKTVLPMIASGSALMRQSARFVQIDRGFDKPIDKEGTEPPRLPNAGSGETAL